MQYNLDVEIKIKASDLISASLIAENETATDQTNVSFKMVMRTGASGLAESADDAIHYSGIDFNCATNAQCSDIDDAVARASSSQERILILQAAVETSAEIPVIVIEDLICDASAGNFSTECLSEGDEVYWVE